MPVRKPGPADAPARYRVLTGLNYPDATGEGELRAETGDIVTDLPGYALRDLVKLGYIEKVED